MRPPMVLGVWGQRAASVGYEAAIVNKQALHWLYADT